MLISFVSGIIMLPGANVQFQIWYLEILPILIGMIGFDILIYFKIYSNIFPSRLHHINVHHVTLISICLYLILIGPKS